MTESLSLDSCIGEKIYERPIDSKPAADPELELESNMQNNNTTVILKEIPSEPEPVAPKYEPEPVAPKYEPEQGIVIDDDKQQPDPTPDTESTSEVIVPIHIPVDVDDSSGSGGGCLIATAAYGTELAPQVQLLREIRDGTLMSTASGSSFMTGFNQFYYLFSPRIADLEREHPAFRDAVRVLITPGIYTLNVMSLADNSNLSVLFYVILTMSLLVGMYIAMPAYVVHKIARKLYSS